MFALAATFMALAPFLPQPHLLEKFVLLINGQLSRPVDIFDLCWHVLFLLLLVVKIVRMSQIEGR